VKSYLHLVWSPCKIWLLYVIPYLRLLGVPEIGIAWPAPHGSMAGLLETRCSPRWLLCQIWSFWAPHGLRSMVGEHGWSSRNTPLPTPATVPDLVILRQAAGLYCVSWGPKKSKRWGFTLCIEAHDWSPGRPV